MLAKDIKTGAVVNYAGQPIIIESIAVVSPSARGAATLYKYRGRNLVTRQKQDIVLKGGDSLPEADFEKRPMKFMYADPTHAHFMDESDYNQHALSLADIDAELPFLTDRLEGMLGLFYNGECVGIRLPTAVELVVVECDPGVKGNSATGRTKPAKLETGHVVHVPEYLKQGETVKVDTRTGEYLSRA